MISKRTMGRMNHIENTVKELVQKLKEVNPRIDSLEREIELLKDLASSILLSVVNLKDSIRSLAEQAEKDRKWIQELEKKAERDREWMRKKWGELAQRLGTLTEDIFAPGIPYLIKKLGYRVKERMLDVEYEKDGHCRQYDALVIAEDREGKEVLFVAEVKSQARSEDFEQLKTLLEDLFKFKPEYVNKKIIPILAAFRIPGDLINLANRRGVLLVRMGGEYLEPLNPEVVK